MILKQTTANSFKNCFRFLSMSFLICFFQSNFVLAQDKMELGIVLGSASYMGDLNPDNPFYQPNFGGGVVGRYIFNDRLAFKGTALGTSLRGSYSGGKVFFPSTNDGVTYQPDLNSQYSFHRPLVLDFSGQVEINFQSFDHPYINTTTFTPYIAIGLGTTVYKRFSEESTKQVGKPVFVLSLPVSVGIKFKLNKHVRLGLDWTFRKVFANDLDQTSANSIITPSDPYGFHEKSSLLNQDWISFLGASMTFNMWPRRIGCNAGYRELK